MGEIPLLQALEDNAAELARCRRAEPPADAPAAPERSFLEHVVRPIYAVVFAESFEKIERGRPKPLDPSQSEPYPKNYDDWNERFWTLTSLFQLQTHGGHVVMAKPPDSRWPLLQRADWASFFLSASS